MSHDEQAIVDTVVRMFAAAKAEDFPAFEATVRPGFFVHENGQRFDAAGIFQLIVDAQVAGARFEWNILEPVVYSDGNLASVAYVNRGAVTRDEKREAVTWLETATLIRGDRGWQVAFMSSMRASAAQ